ncbi:MAG: dockerin type I domain-containing protein, partial [Chthoniobacterales bacterium]
IGGQARNFIARLDPTTGLADSFNPNPNPNTVVSALSVQADGKILVGGGFTSIGGQARNFIARLDATTGSADSFNPTPNPSTVVTALSVQADGKILVGGGFTSIGGQPRNRIARLDPTTGLADSFDPNVNDSVQSITVQPDGKILVGGGFSSIGGQTRKLIARLTNDTAALQSLAGTQNTVTWTRGGSSPQFTRVTFESSTDNMNYALLGRGTAAGSNWTLTGLSLLTGQNIYLRARGYHRTDGFQNGSGSIQESVRNAFITLPPTPTQVVSRKLHNGMLFEINLPLTGPSGVECRSGGATNDYQVVFTFASAVTFTNAALTTGAGTVSSSSGSGTTAVTVNLAGVTNGQRIRVTLQGASDGTTTGDLGVPMGVLVGDTNGNGTVNASDIGQVKSTSGQTTDAFNFRTDVNVSGSINASDIGQVKAVSGNSLP